MAKESIKEQELGPKKYKKKVEEMNRQYDKYKAGTRDSKTGEYYYHIGVKPPRNSNGIKIEFIDLGYIKCEFCGSNILVSQHSKGKCCLQCGNYTFFTDELKEELLRKKN